MARYFSKYSSSIHHQSESQHRNETQYSKNTQQWIKTNNHRCTETQYPHIYQSSTVTIYALKSIRLILFARVQQVYKTMHNQMPFAAAV